MGTRQVTPFFHVLFMLFQTFISEYENTQNSFPCGLPLVHSGMQNIFFDQTLPIWTAHHNFLEIRHPRVTKNLYYFLHPPEPNTHFLGSISWTYKGR